MNKKLDSLEKAIKAADQLLSQPDLLKKIKADEILSAEVEPISASLKDLASRFAVVAAEVQEPGA